MNVSLLQLLPSFGFFFNRGEWSQVYQMIYSEDYNQKLKGLNHMIVWKSRYLAAVFPIHITSPYPSFIIFV